MAFLKDRPERYKDIIAYENTARRAAQNNLVSSLTSNGEKRVASWLLRLLDAKWLCVDSPITISQQELAAFAGSSAPTVQRAFRTMKSLGIIETDYGQFVVRDVERLRHYVENT